MGEKVTVNQQEINPGKVSYWLVGIFITAALVLRILLIPDREMDEDELQHLHAAREIFKGFLPYKDFFEHHMPLLQYLLGGIYFIFGETAKVIIGGRVFMFLLVVVGMVYFFKLLKTYTGQIERWIGLLILLYLPIFQEVTLEIRPDVPALVCLIAGVYYLLSSLRFAKFLAGFLFGLGFCFTQKTIFFIFGAGIYLLIDSWHINRIIKIRYILLFISGILLPLVGLIIVLWYQGIFGRFIDCVVLLNLKWKASFSPVNGLLWIVKDQIFLFLAVLGSLYFYFRDGILRKRMARAELLVLIMFSSGLTGAFIIPVPFNQYLLLLLPFYVFLSLRFLSYGLSRLCEEDNAFRNGFILILIVLFGLRMLKAFGIFPTAGTVYLPLNDLQKNVLMAFWLLVVLGCLVAYKVKAVPLVLIILMAVHPLNKLIGETNQGNRGQLEKINFILTHTSVNDCVMSGWPDYGFLRKQAYYYGFLHDEIRLVLSENERSNLVIKAINEKQPGIISFDKDMKRLHPSVCQLIRQQYHWAGIGDLYIPNSKKALIK